MERTDAKKAFMKRAAIFFSAVFLLMICVLPADAEKREIQLDESTKRVENLDEQGNLTVGLEGYAYSLKTLDSSGTVILERYFSPDGEPIQYKGSYYGVSYRYNEKKQCVEITYLDAKGNVALNASGYAIIRQSYDEAGHAVCDMYYDAQGEQVRLSGNQYGLRRDTFDEQGRCVEFTYIDQDKQPIVLTSGYTTVKRTYNDAGKADVDMYYDLNGEQVQLSLGQFGVRYGYNAAGETVFTTYLDEHGRPMVTNPGYTSVGREYVGGRISTEWYYDMEGQLMELRRGQCGVKYVYQDGELREQVPVDREGKALFFLDQYLTRHMEAVLLGAALTMLAYVLLPKRGRVALLGLYMLFILYMTLYVRESAENTPVSFELFRSFRGFLNNHETRMQILNNMMLFLPFGFFLYLIWPHPTTVLISAVFSVLIEGTQLITGLGWCEIDDVLSNSLGGAVGILVAAIAQKIRIRCKNSRAGSER